MDKPSQEELDKILRSLLDFSPTRFQRQMKDGTVKQLSGMDVFNEAKSAINSLTLKQVLELLDKGTPDYHKLDVRNQAMMDGYFQAIAELRKSAERIWS